MSIRVRVRKKPDREHLQLYYFDPLTGRHITKSAETDSWREAERAAATWQETVSRGVVRRELSRDAFRLRFEEEHTDHLSPNAAPSYSTAMNHFERLIGSPRQIEGIDSSVMSRFQSKLRSEEHPTATVGNTCGM